MKTSLGTSCLVARSWRFAVGLNRLNCSCPKILYPAQARTQFKKSSNQLQFGTKQTKLEPAKHAQNEFQASQKMTLLGQA